jgi:hypothetical protein
MASVSSKGRRGKVRGQPTRIPRINSTSHWCGTLRDRSGASSPGGHEAAAPNDAQTLTRFCEVYYNPTARARKGLKQSGGMLYEQGVAVEGICPIRLELVRTQRTSATWPRTDSEGRELPYRFPHQSWLGLVRLKLKIRS